MADHVLSVDLGGTHMRAAIVAPDGTIVERRIQPTPHDAEGPDALLSLAGDVLVGDRVRGAVVGVPGRVDYARGRLEHAPNLPPHWPSSLNEDHLQDRLGTIVSLANDADLAAVGEAYFGAGRTHEDVAYLTISTGVGAGVLLGRRLVAGRRSLAEIGHTVVDRVAAAEGHPATVEELGSGTSLSRDAAAAGLPTQGTALVALVRDGDPRAREIFDRLVDVVAVAVANLAFLFTPELIVLGGGVGRNGDLLIGPVTERLRDAGPPGLPAPIGVVTADLGDDAGLAGAAAWQDATGRLGR